MKKVSKQEIFETVPVPRAIANLAIPTVMGMLVTIIYNLADTFFVGQIGDPNQVAAVAITSPIFMILMAVGNIFGMGSGSLISRSLGSKDFENVKRTSSFSFYSCIILGLVVAVVGLPFIKNIIHLLGSSPNTFEFARQYLNVIIVGAPFIILAFALGQIIRAEGAAKESMTGMMLGTVINIILDPLFILGFKMGVFGAAFATIIANVISVVYYIIYLIKRSENLSISPKKFKPTSSIVKNIFSIGAPASLTNMLVGLASIFLNNYAVLYGDTVVAALGIVNKIMMLPVLISIGLCQGVQPLIGYNYSANNIKRMKDTLKFTGILGTGISVFITVLLFFIGKYAVNIFINDPQTVELGTHFLRVCLISIPFFGIMFLFISTFQALGKALPSLVLAISRQGLVFIPVLALGNYFFGLNGIVYAQPIADIASTIISVVMAYFVFRKDFNKINNKTKIS
ncbi:MAG: MATE family efflux transporter [Oscillospiraceae bacterium]